MLLRRGEPALRGVPRTRPEERRMLIPRVVRQVHLEARTLRLEVGRAGAKGAGVVQDARPLRLGRRPLVAVRIGAGIERLRGGRADVAGAELRELDRDAAAV